MKAFRYITAVAALATLAACNNDEWGDYSNDPNAVRIHATVGDMLTRSNPIDKPTAFSNGDKVAVSTDDGQSTVYIYDGTDWKPENNKYLTWNKSSYTFTAYFPADYIDSKKVNADQSDATKIAATDYMKFEGDFNMPSKVTLTMQRQTARIIIDATQPTWMNQYKNEAGEVTHEVKSIRIHANGVEDIIPYKVGTKYYALVNTGNANTDKGFITVTVGLKEDSDENNFKTLTVRDIPNTLAAGTSYTYPLIIGKDKVELGAVTLTPWESGNAIGSGTASDGYIVVTLIDGSYSYHIYTLDGLLEVNRILTAADVTEEKLRAHITLHNDFTLPPANGESNWTAIGNDSYYLTGDFNGNGHTIKGLVVKSNPTASAQGLIGFTTGNVSNLTLEGCTVIGNKWVGGIVGINYGYNIENCKVIATENYPVWIESSGGLVGGITGRHFNGTMLKDSLVCESGASITIKNTGANASNVGGIAGQNDTGAMNECRVINKGGTITITSVSNNVGGFVGENYGESTVDFCIRDCSVNGVTVTGVNYVGGFAGLNNEGASIRGTNPIENCTVVGTGNKVTITVGDNLTAQHNPAVTVVGNNNTLNGTAVTPSN